MELTLVRIKLLGNTEAQADGETKGPLSTEREQLWHLCADTGMPLQGPTRSPVRHVSAEAEVGEWGWCGLCLPRAAAELPSPLPLSWPSAESCRPISFPAQLVKVRAARGCGGGSAPAGRDGWASEAHQNKDCL